MLTSLKVKNFALIDDVELDFKDGFTAFVGETGAGKSLLVDAIHLLSGARASFEWVKKDADFAYIEGNFFLPPQHTVFRILQQFDIELETGEDLIISRKITKEGRSICRIQGVTCSLQQTRQIMTKLVDIHGQQANSYLLDEKNHLFLLDIFAQNKTLLQEYQKNYNDFLELQKTAQKLLAAEEDLDSLSKYEKDLAMLIEANVQKNELDDLYDELKTLKNEAMAFDILYEAKQHFLEDQVIEKVYTLLKLLEKTVTTTSFFERMQTCYYEMKDVEEEVDAQLENLRMQKQQQLKLEERISQIFTLQKKFGDNLEEAKLKLEEKIDYIQNISFEKSQFIKKEEKLLATLENAAIALHKSREIAAEKLKIALKHELNDLYMEQVEFQVEIDESQYQKNGKDKVKFLVKTNVGDSFHPLIKIASGGELSRIMLAIKVVFAKLQTLSVIIFDEIDTGVSGKVAEAIARKMQVFGKTQQVFAITHLPQVLSASMQQLYIEKYIENHQTYIQMKYLHASEHEYEVAKMLSGVNVSTEGVHQAKRLIELLHQDKT